MLYFVGTPIGNLKDVTVRAIEVLKSVDEIACEDTRRSLALLERYEIRKPLVSYHKFNEREAGERIISKLKEGKNVAVITDAGMPIISDPGNILVDMLIKNGLEYTVVPGANALVCALVLAGIKCNRFCFLGFLPPKNKERKELLERYKDIDATLAFYSAPHDLKDDVRFLYSALGDRHAALVREITKIHESVERFDLSEGVKGEPRGEYVVIVEGATAEKKQFDLTENEQIDLYISRGMDKKEALKAVAKERGVSKSSLYKYTLE